MVRRRRRIRGAGGPARQHFNPGMNRPLAKHYQGKGFRWEPGRGATAYSVPGRGGFFTTRMVYETHYGVF